MQNIKNVIPSFSQIRSCLLTKGLLGWSMKSVFTYQCLSGISSAVSSDNFDSVLTDLAFPPTCLRVFTSREIRCA